MKTIISVITVCYNAKNYIESTLLSVIGQKSPEIEYIVIDGASTDGTLEILEQYKYAIDVLVSQKDNGIYDAMNIGLSIACGNYVNFLNAGDEFNSGALDAVLQMVHNGNVDIMYSDFFVYRDADSRLIKGCSLDMGALKRDYTVCHQTIFIAKAIAHKYDVEYKIKADYKWTLDALRVTVPDRVRKVELPLVRYMQSGYSEKRYIRNLVELIKLHWCYFGVAQVLSNIPVYIYRLLRSMKDRLLSE